MLAAASMDNRPRPLMLRLTVMGELEVRRGAARIPVATAARRLLALLVVRGRPLLRPNAARTLWPDAPEERACANLRTALWQLNRAAPGALDVTPLQVSLGGRVSVDLYDLRLLAATALDGAPAGEWERVLEGLACAQPLLPEWDEPWLGAEREEFEELRVRALERICERSTADADYTTAARAGLAAVAANPLRESAQRALIRLHIAEGNLGVAAQRYESFARALRRDLGLTPSPQMAKLMSEVATGHAVAG